MNDKFFGNKTLFEELSQVDKQLFVERQQHRTLTRMKAKVSKYFDIQCYTTFSKRNQELLTAKPITFQQIRKCFDNPIPFRKSCKQKTIKFQSFNPKKQEQLKRKLVEGLRKLKDTSFKRKFHIIADTSRHKTQIQSLRLMPLKFHSSRFLTKHKFNHS